MLGRRELKSELNLLVLHLLAVHEGHVQPYAVCQVQPSLASRVLQTAHLSKLVLQAAWQYCVRL